MAIYFDNYAHSEYIYMGDPVGLRDIDPLTICCWIKPLNWGTGGYGRIATKENMAGFGWLFFLNNADLSGGLEFARYRATTPSQIRSVASVISLGVWQHVAVTYNSTSMALFVNGAAVSTSINSSGSGGIMSDIYDNFIVANRGDLGRGYNGDIEDVRIYNRYLSAGEIGAIYADNGQCTNWQDLVGKWTFQQEFPGTYLGLDAANVMDETINGHTGSSAYSTTVWSEGIVGF